MSGGAAGLWEQQMTETEGARLASCISSGRIGTSSC